MRRFDKSERPVPEINPANVCFIMEKSREYLSETSTSTPGRLAQALIKTRPSNPASCSRP